MAASKSEWDMVESYTKNNNNNKNLRFDNKKAVSRNVLVQKVNI